MSTRKPEIRIFVSRRIDVDSVSVPNPLYVPVRCGAVFDHSASPIQGDDTGDNISQKRMTFCELTVQYWAWKNREADYYGLCHYRRYLAFSGKPYRLNEHGLVLWPELTERAMQRFGLLDAEKMRETISAYDLVIPQPAPVEKIPLPHGKARTVRTLWEAHDGIFFHKRIIGRMFELIAQLAPAYLQAAEEYFSGRWHCGYNCYVMNRELFGRLCELQFPILNALEKEGYGEGEFSRSPAYVGEMLFGIFCYHAQVYEKKKVLKVPLVWFSETTPAKNRLERFQRAAAFWTDEAVRKLAAPFFPLGSKRRETLKQYYRRFAHGKTDK